MPHESFNIPDEPVTISPFEMMLVEKRYLFLYGDINEKTAKDINAKLIALAIRSPKDPIILEINSTGGQVSDGISIINTISFISSPVVTIINGQAASMAGLISIMGAKRFITPGSHWMAHDISCCIEEDLHKIKDYTKCLDDLNNHMNEILKEKTKLTKEDYAKAKHGELWLNAEQTIAKKVADKVVYSSIKIVQKKRRKK